MRRPNLALVMLALCLALATMTTSAAAQPSPPTVEDQNDRRLRHLKAEQAAREQAAVELFRSMERNFNPDSTAGSPVAAQPAPPASTGIPVRSVDVLATLLLGLVGGMVGGCAAIAAWIAATRRRRYQAASTS